MALIALPTGLTFSRFRWGLQRYDYDEVSDATGNVATRPVGNSRRTLSIASPSRMNETQADLWIAMMAKLRGRVNHLEVYDPYRQAPKGTMRGTLTLSSSAAVGATQLVITGGAGQAGTTLKPRDWLQIGAGLGSQCVFVTDLATANGSGIITVNIDTELRLAWAAGTAVAWDKPKTYFKMVSTDYGWEYDAGDIDKASGIEVDLLEQWQ